MKEKMRRARGQTRGLCCLSLGKSDCQIQQPCRARAHHWAMLLPYRSCSYLAERFTPLVKGFKGSPLSC